MQREIELAFHPVRYRKTIARGKRRYFVHYVIACHHICFALTLRIYSFATASAFNTFTVTSSTSMVPDA